MRTRRIELEGRAGMLAIEREKGSATIRIDTILANPQGKPAWKTLRIDAGTDQAELYRIARAVHLRVEGHRGTHSDVYGYLVELQRFVD